MPIKSVKISHQFNQKIDIFPNPIQAGDRINFTNQEDISSISLFSMAGFEIEMRKNGQIPSHLPSGIYLLKIKLKSGKVVFKKLIVK